MWEVYEMHLAARYVQSNIPHINCILLQTAIFFIIISFFYSHMLAGNPSRQLAAIDKAD